MSGNPDDVTENSPTEPESTPQPDSTPSPEPNTGPEEKLETSTTTPTPEVQTEEEVPDVMQPPWKVYNEFIYYNPDESKWYCLSCRINLESGKAAGLHATQVHGMKKKYRTITPTVVATSEEEAKINRDASDELAKELFGPLGERATNIGDTADLALRINADQEAKYVSELVKNPYVNYLYAKMKDQRLLFPDWTLADFLREGALIFAASLGCYSEFGQNKEILKQNKYFSKIAINITRSWEEYDAEQEFEEAVGKGEADGK